MTKSDFGKDYFEGDKSNYDGGYKKFEKELVYSFKDKLKDFSKFKDSGYMLEIGCAYGYFYDVVSEHFNYVGIDISGHAIREAKRRHPGIEFHETDILNFSTKRKFDVIATFDVLEHVKEFDKALAKIAGMLKNDGIIVLQIPILTTIYRMFRQFDKDTTHVSLFTEEELVKKLEKHFEILETIYFPYYMGRLHYSLTCLKVPRFLKSVAACALFIAKKSP